MKDAYHLIIPQIVEFMDDVDLFCDTDSGFSDIWLEKGNHLLKIKLS